MTDDSVRCPHHIKYAILPASLSITLSALHLSHTNHLDLSIYLSIPRTTWTSISEAASHRYFLTSLTNPIPHQNNQPGQPFTSKILVTKMKQLIKTFYKVTQDIAAGAYNYRSSGRNDIASDNVTPRPNAEEKVLVAISNRVKTPHRRDPHSEANEKTNLVFSLVNYEITALHATFSRNVPDWEQTLQKHSQYCLTLVTDRTPLSIWIVGSTAVQENNLPSASVRYEPKTHAVIPKG